MAPIYRKEHTPGPWRVGDAGFTVFGPNLGKPSPETIATLKKGDNARRIAACVNACEGMSDPAVEISALRSRSDGVAGMCAEVEFLRAKLQHISAMIGNVDHGKGHGPKSAEMRGHMLNDIRRIIAKVQS